MRYFIIGKVLSYKQGKIVIGQNNIAYEFEMILAPNETEALFIEESEIKIYIYDYVTQFENISYAFINIATRNQFALLLNIKSLGIYTAKAILKQISVEDLLKLVQNHDIESLCEYKFISQNLAKQLIKELNIKLFDKKYVSKQQQVIELLQNLGFNSKIIYKVVDNLDVKLSINKLVEQALKGVSQIEKHTQ